MSKKLTISSWNLMFAPKRSSRTTKVPARQSISSRQSETPPDLAEAQKCQSSLAFSFLLGFEETKRNASPSWSIKDFRTITVGSAQLFRNASRFNEREPVSRAA